MAETTIKLKFSPNVEQHLSQLIEHEFGIDVEDLKKTDELLRSAIDRRDELKKELNVASAEVPTEIRSALREAESSVNRIEEINMEYSQLRRRVTGQLTDVEPMVDDLTEMVSKVKGLERTLDYVKWLMLVEELSSKIQGSLLVTTAPPSLFAGSEVQKSLLDSSAMPSAVSHFAELSQVYESLQDSKCLHLLEFVENTIMFWYRILKDRLASEFNEIVKTLGWPFVTVSTPMPPPDTTIAELKGRLEACFSHLLKLQLPNTLAETEEQSSRGVKLLPGTQPILLPIQLLLEPLVKRFKYHFFGKRQTNAIDKPEWYFTQILNWVRDHSHFLDQTIQPILDRAERGYITAKVEFSRGLLQLAARKLKNDIPDILYDDQLLSHTIDEVLLFDKELRSQNGYPDREPGCLHVLTEKQCFEKWISVERNFAGQKMDALFQSKTAWVSQYKDITASDDAKVPECVENFMTLLLVITERYKSLPTLTHHLCCLDLQLELIDDFIEKMVHDREGRGRWNVALNDKRYKSLPSPTHHLCFLDLQLELIDDFRIRLLQVLKLRSSVPLSGQYCSIVNGIEYVLGVLEEWGNQLFFVQLNFFRREQESMEKVNAALETNPEMAEQILAQSPPSASTDSEDAYEGSVFDSMTALYAHQKQEMLQTLRRVIMDEIMDMSYDYQNQKWLTLPSHKDFITPSISSPLCDVLQTLKARLHQVRDLLTASVFSHLWEAIAESMEKHFFHNVISVGQFNEGGARQLKYDITRGLFPVFSEYTPKPDSYFRILKDSCILLNQSKGTLMLLHGVLQEEGADMARTKLADLKVSKLTVSQAVKVIGLRADIKMR